MRTRIKEQPLIPEIEVFWNEGGLISIRQDPDPSFEAEPHFVVVDASRARALIKAIRDVLREDG